jgi:type VI secretion system protein ImpJ
MERPLFWHQGLFLQPQHFQLNDHYHQTLLSPLVRFLNPNFWGVATFDIQQAALGNHNFHLISGELVFPDMTHVVLPGNALIAARSFDDAWVEGGKAFQVYLGLKKWREDGENVTILSGSDNLSEVTTRYVATTDTEEINDLYHDGPPAQVKRLHYVLKIFWETETDQLGEYDLIPLARLERSGDAVILSEAYIPPCLAITGSSVLLKIVAEIRDQLASRGRQLESYKRDRGVHTAEFGARDMVYLLALRSLNRYVPLLFHFTETQQVHPWSVYSVLKQVIGELSSFSEQITMQGQLEDGTPLIESYDHRRLWECFSGIQRLATQLLDEITAGPEYAMQLLYDGTFFAAELPPAIFEGRNRFFLVLSSHAEPDSLVQAMLTISKLGTRETLPLLIARSLAGIRVEHLSVPPQELPRRANSLYFQIDHHHEHWAKVQQGNNLALYWDTAPDDLKIELMAVGKG